MTLEDIVKSLTTNTQQFSTGDSIVSTGDLIEYSQSENTNESIGSINEQNRKSLDKLPYQTIVNPKQNTSAVILRSGKELQDNPRQVGRGHDCNTDLETKMTVPKPNKSASSPVQFEPRFI